MDINALLDLLIYAIPIFLAVGILGGIYYFRTLDKVHLSLLIYLVVCLLVDLVSRVYAKKYGNNLVFIPISGFFELGAASLCYHYLLARKRFLWPVVALAAVFMVQEAMRINVNNVADFQTYSRVISSFLITVMSIVCFFEWISNEKGMAGNTLLLNSSILIYYAFNLVCFLPVNFLINVDSDIKFSFWFANLLITLIFYAFLNILIWKHGKSRKQLLRG